MSDIEAMPAGAAKTQAVAALDAMATEFSKDAVKAKPNDAARLAALAKTILAANRHS